MSELETAKKTAKELNSWDKRLKDAEYIGYEMGAYGDYQYYRLQDGTYAFTYFSIGD